MGDMSQVLFIFECHLCNPFVVSLSNHEWTALRQAQGERKIDDKTKMKGLGVYVAVFPLC